SSAQRQALEAVIPYAAEDRFDEVLRTALRQRRWLDSATRIDFGDHVDELAGLEAAYRRAFKVRDDVTIDDIESDMADVMRDSDLQRACDALSGGGATDQKNAEKVAATLNALSSAARASALESYFCTDGKPRKSLMSKGLVGEHPDLDTALADAQLRFMGYAEERRGLRAITATIALHRLAGAVLQRYTLAKARRAALDYEDLISKSVFLLGGQELTAWVMFKLDRGIDHILVDEAQDTSPEQWQIVKAFAQMAKDAGLIWRRIPLDLSFRTVSPVLAAVDSVFGDHARTPGLSS